jgi:hypothetical protein
MFPQLDQHGELATHFGDRSIERSSRWLDRSTSMSSVGFNETEIID